MSERSRLREQVDELTAMEFNTGSDIHAYTVKLRDLQKSLAMEVDYAAQELVARLSEVPPPPGEGRGTAKRKARTVSRHLRRAAEGARRSGLEAVRTWASMRTHYEHILAPKGKGKKPIDLAS